MADSQQPEHNPDAIVLTPTKDGSPVFTLAAMKVGY